MDELDNLVPVLEKDVESKTKVDRMPSGVDKRDLYRLKRMTKKDVDRILVLGEHRLS
ncbi:MAG: hypothetical protein WC806_02905 [Candidatus Gracilibacteria bacterium]|jgi:hypothetical protein